MLEILFSIVRYYSNEVVKADSREQSKNIRITKTIDSSSESRY